MAEFANQLSGQTFLGSQCGDNERAGAWKARAANFLTEVLTAGRRPSVLLGSGPPLVFPSSRAGLTAGATAGAEQA